MISVATIGLTLSTGLGTSIMVVPDFLDLELLDLDVGLDG